MWRSGLRFYLWGLHRIVFTECHTWADMFGSLITMVLQLFYEREINSSIRYERSKLRLI